MNRLHRLRLLPRSRELGWTPYAWLVYLGLFVADPILGPPRPGVWPVTLVALVVFLVSYFRGFWARGWERLAVVLVQVALGVALMPVNEGAPVFFIYAASFAGQQRRSRHALLSIAAITTAGLLSAWAADAPITSWIAIVVFAPLIGGVNLHFTSVGRANAELRQARAEVERLAATAERERIARDLHDVLGHTLSLVVLKAQLAARLAERDPARAATEMREVEQVARAALGEVRETIRGYRPTLEEEAGRAASLLETAGVGATIVLDPAALARLARAPAEVMALALREGVTNVVRHAGATRCDVRLMVEGTVAVLMVEDDGRGAPAAEGAGLRGMRERVEVLGGSCARERGAGQRGSRLVVRVPVGGREAMGAGRETGGEVRVGAADGETRVQARGAPPNSYDRREPPIPYHHSTAPRSHSA